MPGHRRNPTPTLGASAALLGAILVGCAGPRVAGIDYAVPITPQIDVHVHGCGTDLMTVGVTPLVAAVRVRGNVEWRVRQAQGDPAQVDSVVIRAKHPTQWPFAWEAPPGQRPSRAARPGMPARGQNAAGPPYVAYAYSAIVYCQGAPAVDFDPEIIIVD
jgi:hypothetical protein